MFNFYDINAIEIKKTTLRIGIIYKFIIIITLNT